MSVVEDLADRRPVQAGRETPGREGEMQVMPARMDGDQGDAFDPARSGLAIAARTGGDARGGGSRLASLDTALFGR